LTDQRGVTMMAIILFGTLALSVVLVNSIAIKTNQQQHATRGKSVVVGYCSHTQSSLPPECTISEAYACGDHYMLRNNCLGTGDIVLDSHGAFVAHCGFTSLDGTAPSCTAYWTDPSGQDCHNHKNLCIK